jgi:hypothetical protein
MTKSSREELAAQGFLLLASRTAARRERERKEKQERSAPATATVDIGTRQFQTRVANPAATAEAIVAAGRKRRGEVDAATPSSSARPATTLAEQIVAAGRKRRGETT